jgi:hypothetical protein
MLMISSQCSLVAVVVVEWVVVVVCHLVWEEWVVVVDIHMVDIHTVEVEDDSEATNDPHHDNFNDNYDTHINNNNSNGNDACIDHHPRRHLLVFVIIIIMAASTEIKEAEVSVTLVVAFLMLT